MSEQSALPGMEQFLPDKIGAADLRDEKSYTAGVLLKNYPAVAMSIVKALEYGIPVSAIADIWQVSKRTVAALRDLRSARPFFVSNRKRTLRGMVELKALETLNDKLDKGEVGMGELMKLSGLKDSAKEPEGSTDKPVKKVADDEGEVIDYDELMDWLRAGKNFAQAGVGSDEGSEGKCSTGSGNEGCCSVEQSDESGKSPIDTGVN